MLVIRFGMDSKVYIVRCNILKLTIYLNMDILYGCRTQIHKVKNMLIIILSAIWASFTCYLIWYVTVAKHNVPITRDDAKTLWKIHKKTSNCNGHKWRPISLRGDKIAGFECECGYKYRQKRPIVSSMPKNSYRDHRDQHGFPVTTY